MWRNPNNCRILTNYNEVLKTLSPDPVNQTWLMLLFVYYPCQILIFG